MKEDRKELDLRSTIVKDYSKIVELSKAKGLDWQRQSICRPIYDPIKDNYPSLPGYVAEADLGLGCGFPTKHLLLQPGNHVLDIGCGAGSDSFIAREAVGMEGKVWGIDITSALVNEANAIAQKRGFSNVEFVVASAEELPFADASMDAVISNGVFSLIPDKTRAFQEILRALKPKGGFCLCDLVLSDRLSDEEMEKAVAFTGCLNGIFQFQEYLKHAQAAGFTEVQIFERRKLFDSDSGLDSSVMNKLEVMSFGAYNGFADQSWQSAQ